MRDLEEPLRQANDKLVAALAEAQEAAEREKALREQLQAQLDALRADDEERRTSEEQLHLMVDAVPVLISYVDSDQRYRFNNRAYEEWFGHPRAQFQGKHLREVLGGPAYEAIRGYVEAALSGQEVSFETLVAYKDGGTRFVIATYVPHVGQQGEVKGFIALIVDITERKQARQQYESIVRSAMDGFWLVDAAGHFLDVNDAYCHLIGYTRDELLTMGIQDVEAVETPQEIAQHIQLIIEAGSDRFETRHIRKDGSVVDIEISVNYLKGNDERFFVFIRDITERKQAVEALKRAHDELESRVEERTAELARANEQLRNEVAERKRAEQFREEYIRLISHDLRNPLSPVSGRAQWLSRRLKAQGLEIEANSAESIFRNAVRMRAMLDDLVESTRLEAGHLRMRKEPTDLIRLVYDIAERVGNMDERARICIETPEWVPEVLADPAYVERGIVNLIGNALKYSPPDKPVKVHVGRHNGEAFVSVSDEGCGIPQDEIPHVFERYFRARTAGPREGLGLGLYISRLIVEAHGGRLWVESEVGKGSTFHLSLPLAQ